MNKDLSQLIQLQRLDMEVRQLQEKVDALPERQAELERQFAASVSEYLAIRQEFDGALARRKQLEAEVEMEQGRQQKFKADLMKATNEREYTTAVREIDITRKEISTRETEILKLMEQIEKLEVQVTEKTPEMESRRLELDRELAALSEQGTVARQRLEALTVERVPLLAGLSAEPRSDYERLSRMRSGFALSEARNYSCTACRMSLRPQVFSDVRRGEKIINCENCGRILYYLSQAETA